MILLNQAGNNTHEDICASLELFAREVMPEFKENEEERERKKLDRLAGAMERALARREPPRAAPKDYTLPAVMKP